MPEITRRDFLAVVAAGPLISRLAPGAASRAVTAAGFKVGYAAITWGGDDPKAIEEVAAAGFKGIQLRASAYDRWSATPGDLKSMLAAHQIAFPVLSSGNLRYDEAARQEQMELHLRHARFVRDAGGEMLQVIDEKPKDRMPGPDDFKRLGAFMSDLGRKTAALGVPLVYHHHMNSTGEPPAAIDAIVAASDPRSVGLLFDIAHYQQGGGDPVGAIRAFGKRIKVVHLKDVRPIDAAPGYQWVELGRGRVDIKGCVAALKDTGFGGWAIVELDKVVDPGGTPKASADANHAFVVTQLGLTL